MKTVFFVEDELTLGKFTKNALERSKEWHVEWYSDGIEAYDHIKTSKADIYVLDITLPSLDGLTLAKEIRKHNSTTPIIFLTAKSQISDVLKGFEQGGNDYMRKPYNIDELIVRIKELLRRTGQNAILEDVETFHVGKFRFSPKSQLLESSEGDAVELSYKESSLLYELIVSKNKLLEKKDVLAKLWGEDNFFNSRTMDVYISRLRKYLEYDANLSIVNVRGVGYKLIEK